MILGLIRFTGQVGIGSILTFFTALVGFWTVWLQTRKTREHISNVNDKVDEIGNAVNGVGPGQQPMVKNVQDIHDTLNR